MVHFKQFMTEALEEIIEEETDTARLCMKEKRSFAQLAAEDSLSIYFIYIPDVETFAAFHTDMITITKIKLTAIK